MCGHSPWWGSRWLTSTRWRCGPTRNAPDDGVTGYVQLPYQASTSRQQRAVEVEPPRVPTRFTAIPERTPPPGEMDAATAPGPTRPKKRESSTSQPQTVIDSPRPEAEQETPRVMSLQLANWPSSRRRSPNGRRTPSFGSPTRARRPKTRESHAGSARPRRARFAATTAHCRPISRPTSQRWPGLVSCRGHRQNLDHGGLRRHRHQHRAPSRLGGSLW